MSVERIAEGIIDILTRYSGTSNAANYLNDGTEYITMSKTKYKVEKIDGLDIFFREAGSKDNPTILLLHGFPTSSHMFRDLIPLLSDKFHLIAPDYPGYGQSSMPLVSQFEYTFDNIANLIDKLLERIGVKSYALYVQDYGAPVGYRVAMKHPERVTGLIVQNGNAFDEGLASDFWNPVRAYWKDRNEQTAAPLKAFVKLETTKWQYTDGVRSVENVSPDTWAHDQALLDRPGNADIQLALLYDYGSNPARYPAWQEFFRKYQPPTLIVWGKNDKIFPPTGAHPYAKLLKDIEMNLLDTGHFALEEDSEFVAKRTHEFLLPRIKDAAKVKVSAT
jgi:pimeloyl-ACP methyl ester carboxylesterase